ncbi:aminopeptidase P1 putativemetallo-peptidase Clan MG Family M24 [Leptomonas pyrrhocoris]|uniref:Aminopeptidase P1 putativemetallo-peptidase Clan MG Family M24 n=1 Tax=Leptomonas pyrrhocoris TaxID=157538 RepID=A0A0N0DRK3_LEPPY|nr:aminopeptidase P1 putativemetallo-peptidase Clan MG Family M24 [Leptomonas pyrrhocoris]XP_015653258.1 aminopeptidase P1 putativemetallo-peptidase Clan MG Family M24 [Leptomonas pyrrhocoris]XP_015653259.1 aminopeptidase P1 putativemetallo-peptidase Clan MG Family M24 [Leptomonas pyrrhocoris]XP_015653260.1 aminopeptidase P1 putativemetallo-peptidase Clan MG Family M24 [Leptomonas pyrrhocoris]KPA74818.1 aminopeptidase P1 putativemetallo-peptidase Clan MG Family M24 [Leptomonas pyrrhocoris]KPA7|eukprot:XP_015653257.1 aminopeptidase P1 putativemetallo-peptidase Clan MG Family M24 [Leptomonas pyrrhocoris]
MKVSGADVLRKVREKMRRRNLRALVVPSSDAHNSEYVAKHLQARAFVSNFHGSAGTALITMDNALLWTDGRYWTTAAEQLYPEFDLMKMGTPETPTLEDWVVDHLGPSASVGLHPYLVNVAEWEKLEKKVALHSVENVVQAMMPPEKDVRPMYVRPAEYCGATCVERRHALLRELDKKKCDLLVLSALDEIAWLTNLRGADVDYNPVFYSYAVIDKESEKVRLYVNLAKVTDEVRDTCADYIDFLPYEQFQGDLKKLPKGRKALVDERQTSEAVYRILQEVGVETVRVLCGPAQKLKAIKNEVELKGFRECHVRDGAALTRYLAWLHNEIFHKGVTDLNEYDAATKLESFRRLDSRFVQLSFESISSTGPNAAMCHYSPSETNSALIRKDQLYLIDSGAQYWDGTTDVTRTISFAPPSAEVRESYTLVLKGHIAVNSAVFPKGTNGARLDTLARTALWNVGLDYAHGTGHGVGSFLNVHEGPFGIGIRPNPTDANMELHCVVSNEPGYYKEGHYGIRIENLEEVVECPTKCSPTGFYTLTHLTMAPLCRDLIDAGALTEAERQWVNDYHAKVKDALEPVLRNADDHNAVKYLKYHTQPV